MKMEAPRCRHLPVLPSSTAGSIFHEPITNEFAVVWPGSSNSHSLATEQRSSSHVFRQYERLAVLAGQVAIGFLIAGEGFSFRIKMNGAARAERDVGQKAQRR